MTEQWVISVKDVYKSFKKVKAVQGVNLNIRSGQSVAILGPNGAGKTTLLEMIEGIQKPDRGDISIMGRHWKRHAKELHRIIGLSLQETRFIDKLTVNETLRLFASFYELEQARVDEITRIVGLEEKCKSYVVNLSGGQRQRLALGISLLNNPKILLLDEPTTGLDPNARREIWSILLSLKKTIKTSLILTTHYMDEAEQLCDYIIIMHQGRILREGTLNQLLDEDHGRKVITFTLENCDFTPQAVESKIPFQFQWDSVNKKGTVLLNDMDKDLSSFLSVLRQNNLQLKNMECRRRTLDDLFIELTGRSLDE